jgi:hypothetical protein
VLTTTVVVPLVAWAAGWTGHWFTGKINPEQYISAAVSLPSPAEACTGGEGWVFAKTPQELPVPRVDENKDAWAATNGGIPASGNYVAVTVQGLKGHVVVVNSISVDVVSRSEPLRGTYANIVGGCGGLRPYQFRAGLDANPVSVTALPDEGFLPEGQEPKRPVDLPHQVTNSEPEVWHLAAITTSCTCEWTATLNWTSDGKQGRTTITDHDRPFRVAAVTQATRVDRQPDGTWVTNPKT